MCPKNYDDPELDKNYLLDLIAIVKEEAFSSINKYHDSQSKSKQKADTDWGKGFLTGYALAYSRVISIMMQHAEAFNIPLSELSLDDIDPDKDLMPGV